MEPPSRASARRTLTPAVILAALFATACAALSISFVAARGGLQMPVAASSSDAAAAVTTTPAPSGPPASSSAPTATSGSPEPTVGPRSPTPAAATPGPSSTPVDPLSALPPCPDHPGCYRYTVQRGDSLSTIADHWGIALSLVEALNPEIADPSTIAVGQTVYLGRSPLVRLDPCPDRSNCYLYVVRPGDRLSTIAGRYGTTTSAILALNPKITNANQIYSGEAIRIPASA